MQLYRRPAPPQGFPTKSWEATRLAAEKCIEAEIKKLQKSVSTKAKTKSKGGKGTTAKKKIVFPGIWKDYKAIFAYAQFEKCGFCESNLLATSFGDVEHYRPKSEITCLRDDLNALGQQQQSSASITNRLTDPVCSTGYYWLAYDWTNYLLACSICNGLKGTIFPVKNKPRAAPPLKTAPLEEPLLLNPFEKKVPSRHLKFQPDGWVLARSSFGSATIATCGLYREPLLAARKKIAVRAYELARDLKRPASKRENPQLMRDCYALGADDADHCGMVRAIFEDVAGITWEKLIKQCATELSLELKRSRNTEKKKVIDESLEKMGRERYEHCAAVRQIFETTCGVTWSKLVERHAHQLAADFMACKQDWKKDAMYQLNWKKKFYMLARDNLADVAVVKNAFEKKSRMDWNELKTEVETVFKPLWTLPPDNTATSSAA